METKHANIPTIQKWNCVNTNTISTNNSPMTKIKFQIRFQFRIRFKFKIRFKSATFRRRSCRIVEAERCRRRGGGVGGWVVRGSWGRFVARSGALGGGRGAGAGSGSPRAAAPAPTGLGAPVEPAAQYIHVSF